MENCQDSIKATVKWIKNQIQEGIRPDKAVRNCHEKTSDYLAILNKRILIQQRALACQCKALSPFTRERCILWEIQCSLDVRLTNAFIHSMK